MNQSLLNTKDPAAKEPSEGLAQRTPSAKPPAPAPSGAQRSIQRRLFERVLATIGHPNLLFELPDGDVIQPKYSSAPVVGRIRFLDRNALWRVITDPMFQFPEMYSASRVEIEGQIEEITNEIFRTLERTGNRTTVLGRLASLLRMPRRTTLSAAKQNIHHHYDIGNKFYSLWLDERMAYTCAYFPRPEATLEEAQLAKFDHVCKKLRLKPNMQVIEAGCGWGGLALHMARHYGVRVRAFNISHEQIEFARRRARDEGLADRAEFIEADWREIRGSCDIFVSIGMLEHVGRKNYRLLGRIIDRTLKSGGRGLIHSIGQNFPEKASPWIERRIFPGGYPPALSEMMAIFETNGFSVLDVENIRLHYAQTLWHWLHRFQTHEAEIRGMFDEKFVRMWRFYLAGSLSAFATGSYQLFQVLFNRAADNDVAMTREHVYQGVDPTLPKPHTTFPRPTHPSGDH